ncbi:MAG: hypothetical protein CR989_03695 [Flavobacteriales bacterium]|nr:MAG: hypothetical protein CR989_03695 [Flavobacteriales bacterium]
MNRFKNLTLLILAFLLSGLIASSQNDDLELKLFNLPDVVFEKLENKDNLTSYLLKIKQPLDHTDSAKGYFYQRAYLTHVGFNHPMVMITEGYNRDSNVIYELTDLLHANQIMVEHRFFGESIPDSVDYDYLNLKQATADLHRINRLFKELYSGKWLSTGISKGGATTIFYRYFYPNDVDVSVPYVAPINRSFEEKRIYTFFDTIGTKKCRKKIEDFQKTVLQKKNQIKPLLEFYSLGARAEYTYLSPEAAFEYTVLEYPFSFWQYGHNCQNIPDKNSSPEKLASHLLSISDITFFSDRAMSAYGSHYYQSATEMGYYGYETKPFKGLLKALPTDKNPHAAFVPEKIKTTFNGQLLQEVNQWLASDKANNFIYIYGGIDTWSASAVPVNRKVNSLWFFLNNKHHGNARIANMTGNEKLLLVKTLENWLGIVIKNRKYKNKNF